MFQSTQFHNKMKPLERYAKKFRKILLQTIAISLSADGVSKGILRSSSQESVDENYPARIAMKDIAERKLLKNEASFAHSLTMGQFRATRLWNNIIEYLKSNVQLARRRCKGHFYEDSFTGKDAVNVVLEYVRSCGAFNVAINRKKCAKLCQTFMNNQIFHSVLQPKGAKTNITFGDSASKLYCFKQSSNSDEGILEADDSEAGEEEELMCVTSAMRLISVLVFDDDEIMNNAFIDAHCGGDISKYSLRDEIEEGLNSKWFDYDDILNKAFTNAHRDLDISDMRFTCKWFDDREIMNKAFIDAHCDGDHHLSTNTLREEPEKGLTCNWFDDDEILNKAFIDARCGGDHFKYSFRENMENGPTCKWFDDNGIMNKAFIDARYVGDLSK